MDIIDVSGDDEQNEIWDLYDAQEKPLGRTHLRKDPLSAGEYHIVVEIYVVNSKREMLWTKRAARKSFPLQWEMTAGSALTGETPVQAAVRELKEETGIVAREDELIHLGSRIELDRLFMETFLLKRDVTDEEIRLQPGETIDWKWVPLHIELTEDPELVAPMRSRLLYYWRELESYLHLDSRLHPWLDWAKELQSLAQQGLEYTKDPYDAERFHRIREIAVAMLAQKSGFSPEKVVGLFANESGYQTPKVECRAAIFQDGKVLLVQERKTKLWSMPGGWTDIGLGLGENCVKESFEEAGAVVTAERLIAVENRSAHEYTPYPYEIYKCYVLCKLEEMHFAENVETVQAKFFDIEALPPLSVDRVTERSIRMCHQAAEDPGWRTWFD